MKHLICVLLACLLLSGVCFAQSKPREQYDEYSWTRSDSPPGTYTLWRGGRWVGSYDPLSGVYRARLDGTSNLGTACECPCDPPVKNFGLDARKLGTAQRYSFKGEDASREKVLEKIEEARRVRDDWDFPNVPDHSRSLRVVVIGASREERDRVVQEIQADLAKRGSQAKAIVDDYDASHWAVDGKGYRSGSPTVYILGSGGNVLHRQDEPANVGKALGVALREPNPRYDPSKDPDLRRDSPAPWWPFTPSQPNRGGAGSPSPLVLVLVGGAFAVIVALILKGGKKP